ncbi:MAG: hypothetical protein JWQ34_3803 [Mucilaginibacter sp.]|uniref:hypothetical protein n=1 Tax=Mucilaginibacter sp. TaxID=1882438 RepID=UPI00262AD887|nr:hypothetical protein [Mucilaginibacter sp.]MDB5005578.1 hypothetical protein [Mucilaginibacter sp.]
MKTDRKIAMVVNHVKMEDEDRADVAFWISRSPAERLTEVVRLRQNYFSWADGSFPKKIEKVVHQRHI